jgi:hypothetical protein
VIVFNVEQIGALLVMLVILHDRPKAQNNEVWLKPC